MKKVKKDIYNKELVYKLKTDYTVNNLSLRELARKYNLKSPNTIRLHLKGLTRSLSQAGELAHKKYPASFKHSIATKKLMSIRRLQWMKNNPEKTAWRLNGGMSYPEIVFKKELEDRGLDKLYTIEREKSVFPYYIDFAFLENRVAVEIDGSQHKEEARLNKDITKDKILSKEGWRVFRVEAKQVRRDVKEVVNEVLKFVGESKSYDRSRVIVKKTKRELQAEILNTQRIENSGRTLKQTTASSNQRKVNRPKYEVLKKEVSELGFVGTGKKYKVSDNAIRKWIKVYEKYGERA
jgi:very-short-patch-repair endonuclease